MVWQLNGQGSSPSECNRWQDATITLADGRAFLAPPQSDKLFCVNLLDGKLLWKQERGQGLYIASVADGRALVVAGNEVRAYNSADGKLIWSLALPEGAAPSGRGFFNGRHYFLPLSSAEVAAIDPAEGRFVAVAERSDITRLGQGVDKTKRLAPDALDATLKAVERYAQEARELGAAQTRCWRWACRCG